VVSESHIAEFGEFLALCFGQRIGDGVVVQSDRADGRAAATRSDDGVRGAERALYQAERIGRERAERSEELALRQSRRRLVSSRSK